MCYLHDLGDTQNKVDCVFYPPRHWEATEQSIKIAFSRRIPEQFDNRERDRQTHSRAAFEFRIPLGKCDWVGSVACYGDAEFDRQLEVLRDLVPPSKLRGRCSDANRR